MTSSNKQETHGPHRSPEEDILHVFNIILQISYYLPLVEGIGSLFENNMNFFYPRSLLETGPVVLKKFFVYYSPLFFFLISLFSSLEEGCGHLFVKI